MATDFFTVELCTMRGLVTHYAHFFLDLASRTVKIAGVTPHPREAWMRYVGPVRRHQRLGGMLSFYYREAA